MDEVFDEAGIAGRVRAARNRTGMSREALAFHSGISWSAIAQVESGRRTNLRPATLAALARALGVTIDYLVCGRAANEPMFQHRALFHHGDEDLLNAAAALLVDAVDRSEAALAAIGTTRIAPLRERLGGRADRVELVDHARWSDDPAHALVAQREFVNRALTAGATWATILAEPLWRRRTAAQVRMWTRFESVLNLVFSWAPVTVVCLYDVAHLDPKLVKYACATHPHMVEHGVLSPSASYSSPIGWALQP